MKKPAYRPAWLLSLLCIFVSVTLSAESLESIESIDAVVSRARDLEEFLARPELLDAYYGELKNYYGAERFQREAFNKIIDQLRELVVKVPELKTRLWETTGLGTAFSVDAESRSYGRRLDTKAWDAHQAAWHEGLEKAAGPVTRAEALKLAAQSAKEAAKLKPGAETRDFYKRLRDDPVARRAAARLALGKIASEGIRDRLGSHDPDLILDTLNDLRNGLRESLRADGVDAGPLTSMVQEHIPALPELLERKELFPQDMRRTNGGKLVPVGRSSQAKFHFRPLPRRLHGIFKGISLRECVGGGAIADLTPERWASVALPGTQLYHVERETPLEDGSVRLDYQGFTQHVPLGHADGRIVGSTDLAAPALRLRTRVGRDSSTLYAQWLAEFQKRMPKEWSGLAVSSQDHINNAGVLDTARSDFSYAATGKALGKQSAWAHMDDLARKIVRHSPGDRYGYSGDMIFDGRGKSGSRLTLIGAPIESVLADPKQIETILHGEDEPLKIRLAREIAQRSRAELAPYKEQVAALLAIDAEYTMLSGLNYAATPHRFRVRFRLTAFGIPAAVFSAFQVFPYTEKGNQGLFAMAALGLGYVSLIPTAEIGRGASWGSSSVGRTCRASWRTIWGWAPN